MIHSNPIKYQIFIAIYKIEFKPQFTIKMSYCCTQNVGHTIKSHNKKLTSSNNQAILPWNCRKKEECPLEGKCRANDIIYKCIASATDFPNNVYLETAHSV